MARYYGTVGFVTTEEIRPGSWEPVSTERQYYGDVIKDHSRWQPTKNVNDDIVFSNKISIVADPYADENYYNIKYVEWAGGLWNVVGVEVQRPRLILTMGGVYNG